MLQGFIVALVTPMSEDGRIDLAAWDGLLDWHLQAGTDGIVVGGSTGESPVLTADEFAALLSRAVKRCAGRVPVLAGTGGNDTAKVIAQTQAAAELGADAALVVTPYYNRPPQRGLEAHYRAIADAATIPLVLYNVPARTAVDLLPETALRLAEHDHVSAIKEAVPEPDRLQQLARGPGWVVLSGDDSTACDSILAGAVGVISVAANVAPRRVRALAAAAAAGDAERARRLDRELAPLYAFLSAESNPIPVKYLLSRMGRITGGLRLPLVPLAPALHARGDRLLDALGLRLE